MSSTLAPTGGSTSSQPRRGAAPRLGTLRPHLPAQRSAAPPAAEVGTAHGPVSAGTAAIVVCNWRDLTHPEGGGSELYVEQVARGLAALGNRVTLLCARVPGQPTDEVRDGVTYRRRGGRFGVYLYAAAALLFRRVPADVVVDVQNGLPWLSRLVTRRPVVVLLHHVHREQWPIAVGALRGRIGWWIESVVAPRLYRRSRYVTVSQATRRELGRLGIRERRTAVVHNGMRPLPATEAARSATPRVAVLGRLVPHKRVEIVLEAAAHLAPAFPDLTVDVIGRGWWEPRLRELAEQLGLDDRICFHGFVDEQTKADLLAQAWVHAVPSIKEGWGLSVIEAAAAGTPSVAFVDAGGVSESVVDGVTGLLVDGGEPEFAAALHRLLADAPLRASLGRAARNRAELFTWERTCRRWVEVLDRTVVRSHA